MTIQPFHLAMPVDDLTRARAFYGELLGCEEGRSSNKWIDFNFFGHQFVTHLVKPAELTKKPANEVDGHQVPVPHFGVILEWKQWQKLRDRLKLTDVRFIIEPTIRFKGEVGEQATMFFEDYSGNALEFKAFHDPSQIFAS